MQGQAVKFFSPARSVAFSGERFWHRRGGGLVADRASLAAAKPGPMGPAEHDHEASRRAGVERAVARQLFVFRRSARMIGSTMERKKCATTGTARPSEAAR